MSYSYGRLATSLALHYLELDRKSRSDLKAIVVMGSMGEIVHNESQAASHARAFKRLGCVFPPPQCTPPANTLCSVLPVLWRSQSRARTFV